MSPREAALALGFVALLFATGRSLVALAQGARRSRALRLGISLPLGVAWTAGLAYAGSHLFSLSIGRKLTLVLALLPVAAALARAGWRGVRPRWPRPPEAALLVAGTLVFAALLLEALASPFTDWDGRMTWGTQARYIADARTVDAPVLREARWWVAHPHYPLLLPIAQSMALNLAGAADERVVRPLYAAFYPSLLLILYGAARRWGRAAAAFAATQGLLAPFPAFFNHGGASGGCSDLPLACLWGAGLVLLVEGGNGSGVLAGILLAGTVLAKSEGLYLSLLALAVVAALRFRRAAGARRLLAAAAIVAAAVLLLVHWRAGIPNRWDEKYPSPGLAVLVAAWKRLPEVAPQMLGLTGRREEWGWLWWTAPLVLVSGAGSLRGRRLLPFAAAALGATAFYVIAYGSSPWPAKLIVDTTWHRFLLQMLVPLLVLLAACFAGVLRSALRVGSISETVARTTERAPT